MGGMVVKLTSITKKYGINFIANILQQGLRFLVLYAAAKQLGPAEFGLVSLILLASGYLMNANLGAVNGLKRQIPLVYSDKGQSFVSNAFFSVFNFNLLATLTLSILTGLFLYFKYETGLVVSAFLVILSISINTYFSVQAYFTSTANWKSLFRLQLACGILLGITLLSLFFHHQLLLLSCYAASFLLASMVLFLREKYQFSFDKKVIAENIKIGFPAMVAGFIFILFQTTDRLVISKFYTREQFGYYSFAWTFVLSLNLLTNLSSEIILQRGAVFFSKSLSKTALLKFLLKYSLLLELLLIIVTGPLIFFLQYAVPEFFPEYLPAMPVITNIAIAYLIQQLALAVANYYYIIGRQVLYNVLLAGSCVVNLLVLLLPALTTDTLPDIGYMSRLTIWSSCIYVSILYSPFLIDWLRNRSHH